MYQNARADPADLEGTTSFKQENGDETIDYQREWTQIISEVQKASQSLQIHVIPLTCCFIEVNTDYSFFFLLIYKLVTA